MFQGWRELWGNDDSDSLVWVAPSTVMNPSLPISVVEEALARDPAKNRAEYLAEFSSDLSDFVPSDIVEAVGFGWQPLYAKLSRTMLRSLNAITKDH